jgi:predicted Ser/Thr protein kinase
MPVDANHVKELFLALLEMPADDRAAYLDTACAGDSALRYQVEAMLRCHANSGELLARSPAEMLQDKTIDADVSGAHAAQADPSAILTDAAQVQSNEFPFLTPSEKPGRLGQLGPYEVEKVLGKGGFGVVLKAFDERLHRVVAIKVLAPAYAASGSARKRFSREARAAAAVKNEQVVGIHDVQGDSDPPYLVMEYIDGVSLQDKIDRHGPLAVTEILRIGMQIAEGLAAAHKQGLVHRDIKPANILLENGVERVKITDFGLARTVDDASVTQSGTVAGTPMYMSPEQADGLHVDHRSDLFSLGTVLYAMCTGRPPFRATGTVAVLKRVVEDTPRPIREINSEIPDWLCDIIAKLHAKKPEDRFPTAKEVAELLGQHLAHLQQPEWRPRPAAVAAAQLAFSLDVKGAPSIWPTTLPGIVLGALFGLLTGLIKPETFWVWGSETPLWLGVCFSAGMGAAVGVLLGFLRVVLYARIAWEIRNAAQVAAPRKERKERKESMEAELVAARWTRDRRIAAAALALVGLAFSVSGFMLFNLPQEQITPAGAQWLVVAVAAGMFVAAALLAFGPTRGRLDGGTEPGPGAPSFVGAFGYGIGVFVLLFALFAAILFPLASISPWDAPTALLSGAGLFAGLAMVLWGVSALAKRRSGNALVMKQAANVCGILAFGCAIVWMRQALAVAPATLELSFAHPTARVVLESDTRWRREYASEKPGHGKTIVDLPAGTYRLTVFVADKQVESAEIVLTAGKRLDRAIEPTGRLQVTNESDEPITIYGLGEPGSQIPPDEKSSQKMTREVVGPRSALVDSKLAGTYRWVRGDEGGECFVMSGQTAFLRIPKKAEPGWVQLFNGTDLAGWKLKQGKWAVKDGSIIADGAGELVSERAMSKNFRLRMELKLKHGAGVIRFRIPASGERDWNLALLDNRLGMMDGELHTGRGKGSTGLVKEIAKMDEWIALELVSQDQEATVRINGKQALYLHDEQYTPGPGNIGMWIRNTTDLEGSELQVRTIEIMELPPGPPPPEEPGWVQLFNGRNLDGWTNPKNVFESWKVEKGVLIGTGDNAFLRSERGPYADFRLRMEAKYVGGTAGLVLREQSPDVAGAGYVCSMENNREGDFNTGAVAIMPTKNLMASFAVPKQVLTQSDQWFKLEVIANGNRIQTFVDGKKAVNFVDIHNDFKEGFIALIVRGKEGELHVKKTEIKELPLEERGWIQLFNGTNLNGWGNPRYHAKWEVVDGVLTGSAKPQKNGMLPALGPPLTNFHLKAQARVSQDGNAGVIFRSTRDRVYLVEFGGGKAGSLIQLSPYKWLVDKRQPVAPGQWFALDLFADGKRVTTKINGTVVADFADAEATAGQIELEVDSGPTGSPATVEFRSIEIKELPSVQRFARSLRGKSYNWAKISRLPHSADPFQPSRRPI